jgi:hypothetical protein
LKKHFDKYLEKTNLERELLMTKIMEFEKQFDDKFLKGE